VRPCSAMGRVPLQAIASESLPRQRQRMRRTSGFFCTWEQGGQRGALKEQSALPSTLCCFARLRRACRPY